METVFLHMFKMSLTASFLALVVFALRLLLKKAPKALFCVLWGFVAVRLIFPISAESSFSLVPARLTASDSMVSDTTDAAPVTFFAPAPGDSVLIAEDFALNNTLPVFGETDALSQNTNEAAMLSGEAFLAPEAGETPSDLGKEPASGRPLFYIASVLWPAGILVMLLYAVSGYVRIRRKVREAVHLTDNIWLCDHVASPFILGIFRPRILLPSSISQEEAAHVIAHEQAHIKRFDHLWKPLGFLLLSVYWFNPVLWIAYIFLCKDIELACDERVIKKMDAEHIKAYSSTLLQYSISRKTISFCPLAFGEVHVKKRIKNVLHYKRPAFWVMLLAVVSCLTVAVCFLTNPKTGKSPKKEELATEAPGTLLLRSLTLKETGSDVPGLGLTTEPFSFFTPGAPEEHSLLLHWSNRNLNKDLTYGEKFDILRYENETWLSVAAEDFAFPTFSRELPRKTSQSITCYIDQFDLSKDGLYRFRSEPTEGQYVWFDFEVNSLYENKTEFLPDSTLLSIVEFLANGKTRACDIRNTSEELYGILLANGMGTVNCFVNDLALSKEYGIREYFMAQICAELTGVGTEQGDYDPATWWATADQWLNIYNNHLAAQKYVEMVNGSGNQPTGTVSEWKNTSLANATYNPRTPMPRPLVWVNYFYNKTKNPDGSLLMELPEFPGITFYADSQKICTASPTGMQTLVSGSAIYTTYVADLNNDNYPEICATVGAKGAPEQLYIIVYDYKNNLSYALQDPLRYDYSIFGDGYSMYVQKTDRTGAESDFVGTLTLTPSAETDSGSLTLTPVHEAIYGSAWTSAVQIDLLTYSNLYAESYESSNRWATNDYLPICHFFTEADWEAFTDLYGDVSVWSKGTLLTLEEVFDEEMTTLIKACQEDELHVTFYLFPHGLGIGYSNFPNEQGFLETLENAEELQS